MPTMRLHHFIVDHREQILAEWESFAGTVSPVGRTMDIAALRDHADQMLSVIAADLMTVQSAAQQAEKSKGRAMETDALPTAAEQHGGERWESGFTIEEMVAEYRALRASVISLWTRQVGELRTADIEDLIRFNEAIDQSVAESVIKFNKKVEEAREMFLAILGHDLRTPLAAIYTSAKFMLDTEKFNLLLMTQIAGSATRTVTMVGDLLDFTRSRLGGGIPVFREKLDLDKVVRKAVEEISAAHPHHRFQVNTSEEQSGEWDCARLSQALTNLIVNAGDHAPQGTNVSIRLASEGGDVTIAIHNMGATIPGDRLNGLFKPMKTPEGRRDGRLGGPTGNLGLGLYIAERIVHAHGGRIEVESAEVKGTTFTVRLPRQDGVFTG
jgi:signal transduction histidine kinase